VWCGDREASGVNLRSSFIAQLGMVTLLAASARAQSAEQVFARARQLVQSGNGAAGRLLVDSVITSSTPDTPAFGEALYWRGALAASSSDSERDFRRFVAEYPFSPHVADALLQLSQLESARGDRVAATAHIEQFLTDNPKHAERPRATLLLVRLLMDQSELPRGCSALRQTLSNLPADAVEVRNQLEYYLPRCSASDVGRGGAVPVEPARPDSVKRDTAVTVRAPERYTLQIAAYKTKSEADALAKRLKTRKIDARVVVSGKLYRVRTGRYATRGAAQAAQRELKAKKIDALVTEIGADDPSR
jgi:hypothetical protein